MILNDKSKRKEDFEITEVELDAIKLFLRKSVCRWIDTKKKRSFSASDIVASENSNWAEIPPFQCLYEKYIKSNKTKESALRSTTIDSSFILKIVLDEDKHTFDTKSGNKRYYKLSESEK